MGSHEGDGMDSREEEAAVWTSLREEAAWARRRPEEAAWTRRRRRQRDLAGGDMLGNRDRWNSRSRVLYTFSKQAACFFF